jgi:catalase
VQIIPENEGYDYKYDIFDLTKVWLHSDYPLIPLGKVCLNRNSENFFAESDSIALSPATLVPGIEPSPDKIL